MARMFVDSDSSADILFVKCFEHMNLNAQLRPVDTALYGFMGGCIQARGQVMLEVRLS